MPTIDKLSAVDSLSDSDQVPVYSASNGDARKVSVANLRTAMTEGVTVADDKTTQYASPLTGATVTVTPATASVFLYLTPAGTLANLALALPGDGDAFDRQEVLIVCTQIVTALTITAAGLTVSGGAPSALTAYQAFRMRYDAVNKIWIRVSS